MHFSGWQIEWVSEWVTGRYASLMLAHSSLQFHDLMCIGLYRMIYVNTLAKSNENTFFLMTRNPWLTFDTSAPHWHSHHYSLIRNSVESESKLKYHGMTQTVLDAKSCEKWIEANVRHRRHNVNWRGNWLKSVYLWLHKNYYVVTLVEKLSNRCWRWITLYFDTRMPTMLCSIVAAIYDVCNNVSDDIATKLPHQKWDNFVLTIIIYCFTWAWYQFSLNNNSILMHEIQNLINPFVIISLEHRKNMETLLRWWPNQPTILPTMFNSTTL